jgi:hypothetical protein
MNRAGSLGVAGEDISKYKLDLVTKKTKYMSLSRHQNAGQNHDIKDM